MWEISMEQISDNPTKGATRAGSTLFDKVWDAHLVESLPDGPDVLAIDLHLLHEVTSVEAFDELDRRGLPVRYPERTLAVMDHVVPSRAGDDAWTGFARTFVTGLRHNCDRHGVPLLGYGNPRQGIVHVIGPELGLTLPGSTIVCGDSHTSTHGALGAVAFGIGTTQLGHVLGTQALIVDRPLTMHVQIDGTPAGGATSKDVALALIARYGNQFGSGYAIEFGGGAVSAMSIEARMTLCNMSIEFGARMGLVAPDERTLEYLKNTPYAPDAESYWRTLPSTPDAGYDKRIGLDVDGMSPYVTWGTTPAQAVTLDEPVPEPDAIADGDARDLARRALVYMDLAPGTDLRTVPIDAAFIGSCTNGRLEDLRAAAEVLRGRTVAPTVRAIVVPGSMSVRAQAEGEGLDEVFRRAGFDWRGSGCSLCVAGNGDVLAPGTRAASSTNRNFEGRQGTGARTHLMSPACVAASAVAGVLAEPGDL
jgi:3-isopropylmalate/(R)-2-methylmalate dehydratase large subunit